MPNVSVIIPFYNVEEYLPKCLDSVVNQTLQDIEIICVDDGSTDNSAAIVEAYRERHSNITLLRQENGGPSIARNAGLDIATGEYIYFLDSDDTLELHGLERLYDVASAGKLDMLSFNTEAVFETEELAERLHHMKLGYLRTGDYSGTCTGQTMFARQRSDRKYFATVWLYLFRRDFLEEQGILFYPGILHEDQLFTFRCIMTARRVDYIPDRLHTRRLRKDSIMTVPKTIRHLEGYAVVYSEILSFLRAFPLEAEAEPLVLLHLRENVYTNFRWLWNNLPEQEREGTLRHGGVVAAHLVALLKHDQQLAKEAAARTDRLQQRVEVLTQQRDRLKATNEDLQRQLKRSPVARLKSLFRAILRRIRKPK